MDRIEPADGSRDPPESQAQQGSEEASPVRPALYSRNRTLSRSRRPSIRIQRPPSNISLQTLSTQNDQSTQDDQQTSENGDKRQSAVSRRSSNNISEDEEWQGSRRRSSSEPRPGRWSAPHPAALSRVVTSHHNSTMSPLAEESSNHQTPIATSPTPGVDAQLLAPPPAVPRENPPGEHRNLWRRTSQAALDRLSRGPASTVSGERSSNRLSRMRASTVSGSPNREEDYYQPHVVDVLDVIGKFENHPMQFDSDSL